jgi:hypothetical protein
MVGRGLAWPSGRAPERRRDVPRMYPGLKSRRGKCTVWSIRPLSIESDRLTGVATRRCNGTPKIASSGNALGVSLEARKSETRRSRIRPTSTVRRGVRGSSPLSGSNRYASAVETAGPGWRGRRRPVNCSSPGRGSSEAEQAAHNRCVAGSIPAPATSEPLEGAAGTRPGAA